MAEPSSKIIPGLFEIFRSLWQWVRNFFEQPFKLLSFLITFLVASLSMFIRNLLNQFLSYVGFSGLDEFSDFPDFFDSSSTIFGWLYELFQVKEFLTLCLTLATLHITIMLAHALLVPISAAFQKLFR